MTFKIGDIVTLPYGEVWVIIKIGIQHQLWRDYFFFDSSKTLEPDREAYLGYALISCDSKHTGRKYRWRYVDDNKDDNKMELL